jgi:hypothetical protein
MGSYAVLAAGADPPQSWLGTFTNATLSRCGAGGAACTCVQGGQ